MFLRPVLLSILTIATLAAPAAALLPCVDPAADPCVINSTVNIPVGIYDIRPKSLVIGNKQLTVTGDGELKIDANNITFQPGGRLIATGIDFLTRKITLGAAGFIDIQSQGTSKSKIDVSGSDGGGTIDLHSVGNLTVNGTLISNAADVFGFGGPITLTSDTGDISVTGDPSEGIKSFGNAQGGGGSITLTATLGSVSIDTQIVPKGGDCSSCSIDLFAGQNLSSSAQGVLDMRASGIGDGGELLAGAGGDINLAGDILANGSSDEFEGGAGGSVDLDAGGSLTVGGRIELNGSGRFGTGDVGSVDGDGGTGDFAASGDITMNGPMFAISKGYGASEDFDFDALGNVNFNAEIDLTGDVFGANLTLVADKAVTITGRLRTQTMVDPNIEMAVTGGGFDMEACQINITGTGELISTGPGGNPFGSNILAASTGLTVGGKLIATDVNELTWRTSAPIITGMAMPPPVLIQNQNLPCCGVQCPPPPTTSTSSTSTTSTSSPSTSSSTSSTSSSTSSSSSTIVLPTTTSTTSATPTTVVPTTSTTSPVPTSSSTSSTSSSTSSSSSTIVLPTTTSTTSATPTTVVPTTSSTTTTSSTLGATTSSTSTTTAVPTTSAPSTTSTVATTSSTSTTAIGSTTSSSTLAPVTTTTLVVPTSSTTTVVLPTTTSTTLELTCFDTAVGIAAVQCRLDAMNDLVLGASQDDLGGKKIARQVTKLLDRATTLVQEGAPPRKLKNAQKKLRSLVTKLNNALIKGNANAQLVNELSELATDAQNELNGLTTT